MQMLHEAAPLVDLVIGFTVIEGVVLAAVHRVTGRGPAAAEMAPNLAAGLCLLFALRSALAGAAAPWIALWLLTAGAAHGCDLWRRWPSRTIVRQSPAQDAGPPSAEVRQQGVPR